MTYEHYRTQMQMKFPHHEPMSEHSFNEMMRVPHEMKPSSMIRKSPKKIIKATFDNYDRMENRKSS